MKKMSRVDSKAEILQKNISMSMLKKAISKSVLMLLMMIIATGAMSFTYDSTIKGGIDTNANAAKSSRKNLPVERNLAKGNYRKIVHVALPGTKAVLTADREVFASFGADGNVTISTANFEKRTIVADWEMSNNFILSTMHPIANNAEMADEDMICTFINVNMVKPILQDKGLTAASDEALKAAFISQYFNMWFAAPRGIDALISDSEMGDAFEEEHRVKIFLPNGPMVKAADAEISAISKQ